MRVQYKQASDVLLLTFNDKPSARGIPVTPDVHVHVTEDGELVEIELLSVSRYDGDVAGLIARYGTAQA